MPLPASFQSLLAVFPRVSIPSSFSWIWVMFASLHISLFDHRADKSTKKVKAKVKRKGKGMMMVTVGMLVSFIDGSCGNIPTMND
jgi:hypothetical protein